MADLLCPEGVNLADALAEGVRKCYATGSGARIESMAQSKTRGTVKGGRMSSRAEGSRGREREALGGGEK